MIHIIALLVSMQSFAADQAPKDLVDHYNLEISSAQSKGLKKIENSDHGYLVKIEGEQLLSETSEYALYKSQVRYGDNLALPVVLFMTPSFKEQFEMMKFAEKKKFEGLKKLSSEGGGSFSQKPLYEIYVLARPKLGHRYLSPIDGKMHDTVAFEVAEVCKSSGFTNCTKIASEQKPGLIKRLFGN